MNTTIIDKLIRNALREDAVRSDVTTNTLIPKQQKCQAVIVAKKGGVVCGAQIAVKVFKALDPGLHAKVMIKDGRSVKVGDVLVRLAGRTRSILSGERTALNFLGYLSGMATLTQQFVKAVEPYPVKIMDTRKTTPGLRALERYAVRCGGGFNHRFDLKDAVLIKDNHLKASSPHVGIVEAIRCFRAKNKHPIEIEVDTLDQFRQALSAGPEIILLDNMTRTQMRRAVEITRALPGTRRPLLEVSGGVTLKTVKAIAATGVDRISIGALTHSSGSLDVSLEVNDP